MNKCDELNQRMEILFQGEIISKPVYQNMVKVIHELADYQLNYEKEVTFVTHLAMALARIESGDIEEKMAIEIIDQIKASPYYYEAFKILTILKEVIELEIPDSEEDYLLIHLSNMLNQESGE